MFNIKRRQNDWNLCFKEMELPTNDNGEDYILPLEILDQLSFEDLPTELIEVQKLEDFQGRACFFQLPKLNGAISRKLYKQTLSINRAHSKVKVEVDFFQDIYAWPDPLSFTNLIKELEKELHNKEYIINVSSYRNGDFIGILFEFQFDQSSNVRNAYDYINRELNKHELKVYKTVLDSAISNL